MRLIVATHHYAGLGVALRLQDLVGQGLVTKAPLAELVHDRERLRDAYWIWDENHSTDVNEQLRRDGFTVFLGEPDCDTMEHDRDRN